MNQESLLTDVPGIPVNHTVHPMEVPRLSKQCQIILDRLRDGEATNRELAKISLKYTGRISDLRKAGYKIKLVQRDHFTGLNVYRLQGGPCK